MTLFQLLSSSASRKALEPLVLVRSPTMSTEDSCRNGTLEYSDDADASKVGVRLMTSRPRTRSTTWRRCSGVVPQQPPTSDSPYSVVKRSWASASSSGDSGYPAPPLPR